MRRLSGGEGALLGLTALFLCALFVLHGHPGWIAPETEVSVSAAASSAAGSGRASSPVSTETGSTATGSTAAKGAAASSKIDINTASAAELTVLPGIGEVLAGRIVDYREEHGYFSTPEELKNVKGIGDAKFEALREWITCD